EHPPQLVERAWLLAAQPVAQLEDPPLPVGELVQELAERLVAERRLGGDLRGDRVLVGQEAHELGLLVLADRLLERDNRLGAAEDVLDLLRREAGRIAELLDGRLTAELADEHALGAADLVE